MLHSGRGPSRRFLLSLPASVFGFARFTLALAFLPFERWEVPSAEREGPQLMSRGCPPLAVQAAGRVVSRWTPPTPPSASIHFIFRVCLGLFVRQSGDHHLLVFPKTNYAPDTTLKTLLWLSKNEHRRSAEGSQLRPGLPSFTSLLPCSTLPSALGRLRPTVQGLLCCLLFPL